MKKIHLDSLYYLDQVQKSDARRMVECLSDPVFSQMTQSIPFPYTKADADQWIQVSLAKKDFDVDRVWAIRDVKLDVLHGLIGVHKYYPKDRTVEVGYWVAKPSWGKGLASKALKGLVSYLFDQCQIKRVTACTFVNNVASQRVLEKNDFQKLPIQDACLKKGDQVLSMFLWEKIQ